MASDSRIGWCHHTFNAWWGCTKIDATCTHCYAAALARSKGQDVWGPNKPRRFIKGLWAEAYKWNDRARVAGERHRVFAQSMADTFEDFDGPVVDTEGVRLRVGDARTMTGGKCRIDGAHQREWLTLAHLREALWALVEDLDHLDILLLTQRPESANRMVPDRWLRDGWPANAWFMASAGTQATIDRVVPELLAVPGPKVRGLSCEPLLGPIDLTEWACGQPQPRLLERIDWVIVGCESSGPRFRTRGAFDQATYLRAAHALINQCRAAGVAAFHKQRPHPDGSGAISTEPRADHWPDWAAVQQFPEVNARGVDA